MMHATQIFIASGFTASIAAVVISQAIARSEPPCPHHQQAQTQVQSESASPQFAAPRSLVEDHEQLHTKLQRAIDSGGKTAEAARAVFEVLHPHFLKEDAIATPPLALLDDLAAGKVEPWMRDVLPKTEQLKTELPQMLREHEQIKAALERLASEAEAEHKPEIAQIAQQIKIHAEMEEQVLYPAAILVGEYLKLRLPDAGEER